MCDNFDISVHCTSCATYKSIKGTLLNGCLNTVVSRYLYGPYSMGLFLLVFNIVLILMSILFNTCRSRPTTCAAGHLWNFPCVSMRWSSKPRHHHQASAKISSIYAANKYIDIMTLPHRRMLYIILHFPYQQLNNISIYRDIQ